MTEQTDHSVYHISGKRIAVYPGAVPGGPVVYLNSSEEEEEQISPALEIGRAHV